MSSKLYEAALVDTIYGPGKSKGYFQLVVGGSSELYDGEIVWTSLH